MSMNDIRKAIISGDELDLPLNGKKCLLYGWEQCDGFVLSLECQGELLWQSAPMPRAACAEEFIRYYSGI